MRYFIITLFASEHMAFNNSVTVTVGLSLNEFFIVCVLLSMHAIFEEDEETRFSI